MKHITKKCIVFLTLFVLLVVGIISVQMYVSRKVLPKDYLYDISYMLSIAERNTWTQPSKLSDLVEAYEVVCSDWYNNPHEPTYNYIKRYNPCIFCFTRNDIFYYVDCLSGNYFVSSLFNPCTYIDSCENDSSMPVYQLGKISHYRVMIDSIGECVRPAQDSIDIFFQIYQSLVQVFPLENYCYEIQTCLYDYETGELTNYCTGEVIPLAVNHIINPFLKQIKMTYPSIVKIKFCARIPQLKE